MKDEFKAVEVRQHNALTTARYEYTEIQLDVFFVLLSKLRKDKPDTVYEVSVQSMSEITNKQYNYKKLREATQAMGNRSFEIETVDELGQRVLRQLWLFKRVDYILGTGRVRIEFTEPAIPYLFDLQVNFTSFELQAALLLTSKHAKRIYTICSRYRDLKESPRFKLLEFKKMLGLVDAKGDEEYTKISMFKAKVLDIAVRQINEHTNLRISYELEKDGRSYNALKFIIKTQQVAKPLPFELVSDEPAATGRMPHQVESAGRLLAKLNIVDAELVSRILSNPTHVAACNKFSHDINTGKHAKVRSLSGLLLTSLGLKKPANGPLFDAHPKNTK
ncbi:MAG: RepB family plasmid replication initiator protein [Hymenobacter sp.]|nr:MAG: RepB family plasmid replication initiator protein [Hymenobacter sp.]